MTRKIALIFALAAVLVFLMGCMAPEYQFCCYKDEALNETDPVCKGMNEEGEEVELEVTGCSEDDWACELEETYEGGENDGEHKIAPICPHVKTSPCNTTCAGIFCGSFFYDPRPLAAGYGSDESHAAPEDEDEDDENILSGEPMGLWNAQCQLKEMTPLFLRQLENSDNIVMNKFRFGIGQSFQDFEDAQYYFPLTDRACFLNPSGNVDRYTVYAIDGDVCPWNSAKEAYVCHTNAEIASLQFYDCALRCNLFDKGYDQTLDPLNPYLTDGVAGDNWMGGGLPFYSDIPYAYPLESTGDARSPGAVGFGSVIEYPLQGTILYGASFGYSHIQPSASDGRTFMSFIAYDTREIEWDTDEGITLPEVGVGFLNYEEPSTAFNYLSFNQEGQVGSRDVFFTAEGSSQAVYPWFLAHHSVYNYQFRNGHYLPNGDKAGGAEFECSSGQDCLSGYCNNFDYKRGACLDAEGNDVLCDCKSEFGQVVCMGAGNDWMNSWDQGSADLVELPTSRSATVDYSGKTVWDSKTTQTITSLPSIGKVVEVQFTDGTEEQGPMPGDELAGPVPLFVLYLGGPTSFPDYTTRTWDYIADSQGYAHPESDSPYEFYESEAYGLGMVMGAINPCMVFPDDQAAPWDESEPLSFDYEYDVVVINDDDSVSYTTKHNRYCCDGSTSCTAESGETVVGYETGSIPDNAGYLSTRFIENCMKGYETDVHVCYNADPQGRTDEWGWKISKSRSGYVNRPLRDFLETTENDWSLCHVLGEGVKYVNNDHGEEIECYQWKMGGAKSAGSGDTCLLQAETYVIVEPRWDEELGRYAFGNCLLNENGNDLEIKEYGVCESCGYLTMAKQDISPLPEGWVDLYDPAAVAEGQTYESSYCPDLEISTPYGAADTFGTLYYARGKASEDLFYALDPNGMNGYVNYKYGSNTWGMNEVEMPEECIYPNGYTVFNDNTDGDGIPNTQRGLPNIYPNAYYVNKKLESMMKRNIQPVLFATSSYLWGPASISTDTDMQGTFETVMRMDGGDPSWSTFELIKELYATRDDLFVSNPSFIPDGDDDSTGFYYTSGGKFLGNTVINEGAAIIVLYDLEGSQDIEGRRGADHAQNEMSLRSRATRLLCPNCMTSIAIGYGEYSFSTYDYEEFLGMAPGELDGKERAEEIGHMFDDFEVDPSNVDVISMNVVIRKNDFCSIGNEEERFAAILNNLTYIGSYSIREYQKPMLITDFVIESTETNCWDSASAGRLMTYLGVHSSDLSKSGYLGLIYGEWQYDFDSYSQNNLYESTPIIGKYGDLDYRDEFFEGAFVAARKFAGHSLMTYYMEVPEKEVCECTPCTMADNPAICNGRYLGTEEYCFGYENGDYSKWPDNCITHEVCDVYGGAVNKQVACEIVYDNGTIENKYFCGYDIEQTPSGFRDVVSSLEDEEGKPLTWCFPLTEGQDVTYQKSDHHSYDSLPAVFSMDGNISVQCNPASGLLDSFCGYYPPITKYQIKCVFTGEYCELGEEYDADIPLE